MLRRLRKRIKGQSTAEYAILIALVIGAVIAMQTYAKRALNARIKDATDYMINETSELGSTAQYEPYYLSTSFEVTRSSDESVIHGNSAVGMNGSQNIERALGGYQEMSYNGSLNAGP